MPIWRAPVGLIGYSGWWRHCVCPPLHSRANRRWPQWVSRHVRESSTVEFRSSRERNQKSPRNDSRHSHVSRLQCEDSVPYSIELQRQAPLVQVTECKAMNIFSVFGLTAGSPRSLHFLYRQSNESTRSSRINFLSWLSADHLIPTIRQRI